MPSGINRREIVRTAGVGAVASTAGCMSLIGSGKGKVAIGGKQFTEQLILSQISAQLLSDAGFGTEKKFPVGGNAANHKAVTSGRVDHYWEYTGTGWNYHLGHSDTKISNPQKLHKKVDQAYQKKHNIEWLKAAEFNNTYVVTANPEWQKKTGVKNLSQLAQHINNGGKVTWAVSQEYINNPTAFGKLPEFYGFDKSMNNVSWKKMAIGTINYKAVAQGKVDLGVGFSTNPNLQKFDLVTINDDKNWFVIYYPAPLVNKNILTDEMKKTLNKPTSKLDTKTMQKLNAKVSIQKKSPKNVAKNWLKSEGML